MGVAAIATLLGVAGTGVARMLAIRLRVLDEPNPIVPDHREPIPYLGGLGILAGAFLALAAAAIVEWSRGGSLPLPPWMLLGGSLFLSIGLVDDLREFGALGKIVLQFVAAGIVIAAGAPVPAITGVQALDAVVAVVWLVGVVNAVNVIDVCDGLAASVCLVTFAAFAVALSPVPVVAAALAGSCLGFLYWNRPRARIFMGDAGSHFLGFFVGALALTATVPAGPWPLLAMLGLFAGVPIFDLFFQSLTRAREGRAWYKGGPDSFALRLQQAGLSKVGVDAVASATALVLWLSAYELPQLAPVQQAILLSVLVAAAAIAWRWLLRYRVTPRPVDLGAAVAEPR